MKYKEIENNILIAIGESKALGEGQTEITEDEYNTILSVIQNKPEDTETTIYKLNAETLEYEPYDRPEEPEPEPEEPKYTLDEAATILASEVNAE